MNRLPLLALCLLAVPAGLRAQPATPPAAPPPLTGTVTGNTYISPTGAFKVPVPVLTELGGSVTDTENVVTFEDNFSLHISIAAFELDASQRWELRTRGPKEYLVYFFTTFVMPDFMRRYEGTRVESARFLPSLNDGALLTYTLLPGGSMFAARAALAGTDPKSVVAKRGNLLFVKSDHIFVLSTELAEHALERSSKRTTAEEDELLRQRLLDLLARIEFTRPVTPDAKK